MFIIKYNKNVLFKIMRKHDLFLKTDHDFETFVSTVVATLQQWSHKLCAPYPPALVTSGAVSKQKSHFETGFHKKVPGILSTSNLRLTHFSSKT